MKRRVRKSSIQEDSGWSARSSCLEHSELTAQEPAAELGEVQAVAGNADASGLRGPPARERAGVSAQVRDRVAEARAMNSNSE